MTDASLTTARPRGQSVARSNKVGIEMPPSISNEELDEYKKPDDDEESGGRGKRPPSARSKKAESVKNLPPKVAAVKRKQTRARRWWVCFTWAMTWWIPAIALRKWGRMKTLDVQMAWREKVALCCIILFLCALMIFFVQFFSILLCPNQAIFSTAEIAQHSTYGGSTSIFASWNGYVYNIDSYVPRHTDPADTILKVAGTDVSAWFPRVDPSTGARALACPSTTNMITFVPSTNTSCYAKPYTQGYCHQTTNLYNSINVYHDTVNFPIYRVGSLAFDKATIYAHGTATSSWILLNGRFYDITELMDPINTELYGIFASAYPTGPQMLTYLQYYVGRDASLVYNDLKPMLACLDAQYFVGVVDDRISAAACYASEYILLGCTGVMVFILVIKFLAALQLGSKRQPEHHDRFVIMQVPCYTENEDSLRKTFDSLSLLDYDDTRKLLFVVADGLVKGAGNDLSTPEIVLKILGVDPNCEKPIPRDYVAIAEGSKGHNRALVYSGLYRIQARAVPYIVVVKSGKADETGKLGNRGKRDSQMILMKFLNKVHYQTPMTPLDLEMYHHIKNIIGVHPYLYEYVLMVDADTEVVADSLNRLISCCIHDGKIMGICGETKIANEKQSWVTMMQVYEYYISHHMAKAFESLFGTVTCLPGCFTMYRVRTPEKKIPLLASSDIIAEYEENVVDTLHKKNLLALGEDRFLTTLMLKYFPEYRTKFTPDARCYTIVPDSMSILLSQRRRWINSTIHNLFELLFLPQLCGCMIFSMRFVVFFDLFATLIMPATTAYLAWLIYSAIKAATAPIMSLIMIAAAYGLQAIIFIIKREYQHIGWMIINVLAMPVFSFWLPLYSFWHFDDFSWGNTRKIAGAAGKDSHGGDTEIFDPSIVPVRTWEEHEAMMMEQQREVQASAASQPDPNAVYYAGVDVQSEYGGDNYGSEYSYVPPHQQQYQPSRPPSMYAESINGGGGGARGTINPRRATPSVHSGSSAYQSNPATADPRSRTTDHRLSYIPLAALHQAPQQHSSSYFNPGSDHSGSQPAPPATIGLRNSKLYPSNLALDRLLYPTPDAAQHEINSSDQWNSDTPPTDEDLVQRIRFVIANSDLRTLTKRKVREELSAFFKIDLMDRKVFIGERVEAIVTGRE
ncbi:chitin synthase 6 [Geranomyces variabilis]|nr:chitin synthase 6 [Geranomyces variabilis]KAJ3136239.1 hypothetical protein HDU90_003289 [Geranomyces variabilis]